MYTMLQFFLAEQAGLILTTFMGAIPPWVPLAIPPMNAILPACRL